MKEPPRHDMDDYGQHDPNIGSAQLPRLFRPIYQRTVIDHLPPSEAELSGWTPRQPADSTELTGVDTELMGADTFISWSRTGHNGSFMRHC